MYGGQAATMFLSDRHCVEVDRCSAGRGGSIHRAGEARRGADANLGPNGGALRPSGRLLQSTVGVVRWCGAVLECYM